MTNDPFLFIERTIIAMLLIVGILFDVLIHFPIQKIVHGKGVSYYFSVIKLCRDANKKLCKIR
ncbi:MAG: hypothetical protein PSX81_02665 [bacterium]|nr:hypothetical protein [bacterium]